MTKHYRSKVDIWLVIVLASAMTISIGSVFFVESFEDGAMTWITALIVFTGVLLPVWIFLRTDYTLDQRMLRIRSGPFRWTVPLKDIRLIEPTRSTLSSPALSLDRIRIDYADGKSLMISPRDSEQFLKGLEAMRAPR